MNRRARFRACAACVLAAALPPLSRAQKKPKLPKWKIDPYTRNDPKAMKKAGYVSFGPFAFGDKADTTRVEAELGKVKIRWVETAHFKIGADLSPWILPPVRETRKKIRGELERLAKKLPRINVRVRKLDPWLRLHLFAQRFEDLYADFSARLGVTDDSFPKQRATYQPKGYMGEGPYLGQPEKYTVLMFRKESDHLRFLTVFTGRVQKFATRHNFKVAGTQFICTAEELDDFRLRNDTALHCHMVFNITHNLINGYRFYAYDLPVWLTEGLAHWFGRRVDPKWNNFDQNESSLADMKATWRWKPKVRSLVTNGRFRPSSEMMALRDFGQLKFNDHMICWSRVEFLMSRGDEKFAKFMNGIKGLIDTETQLTAGKELLKYQRRALREAYGLNAITFDEKWKEHVLKTYPTR